MAIPTIGNLAHHSTVSSTKQTPMLIIMGHLWGKYTDSSWIPLTNASDAERVTKSQRHHKPDRVLDSDQAKYEDKYGGSKRRSYSKLEHHNLSLIRRPIFDITQPWPFSREPIIRNAMLTGGFPHRGPVIRSFDFLVRLNKLLNKLLHCYTVQYIIVCQFMLLYSRWYIYHPMS